MRTLSNRLTAGAHPGGVSHCLSRIQGGQGRGALPSRLLPRRPPHRRLESPGPDRRRGPVVGGPVGRGSGVSVDDEPEYLREYEHLTLARLLLAQSRPISTSTAARGARSSRPAACRGGRTRGGTAAYWRSGCCRPWPTMPAVTSHRRSPHSAGARRHAGAGQLRAAVPGRGRPDAGPPAARGRCPDPVQAQPTTPRARDDLRRGGGRAAAEPGRPVEPPRTARCCGCSTASSPGPRSPASSTSRSTRCAPTPSASSPSST